MPIHALRTPDDRFEGLPGYDFAPHYADDLPGYEGLRMHWLDEGPADAEHTYLCLHGEPSWCYLYRKMLPVFTEAGGRVIAPDFFGFGRSDKPVDDATYTFDFHRDSMLRLIERLDLQNITLVCQDWGGLLGLTIPPDMADRFSRLLIMNTALATGVSPGKGFEAWKENMRKKPDFNVGGLFRRSVEGITEAEVAAYDAPYPDVSFKGGVRTFPELVPVTPEMPGAQLSMRAAGWWSSEWKGKSFMAVGMQDPVLGPKVMAMMRQLIAGCPEPMKVESAGHFVQEHGESVAKAALVSWGN